MGDDDNDLMKKFAEASNKSEMAEVLKELFDQKKIFMISDLSEEKIGILTRIRTIGKMKGIKSYTDIIEFYSEVLLSKNRSSRREILEAIRGHNQSTGIFDKLNPFKKS